MNIQADILLTFVAFVASASFGAGYFARAQVSRRRHRRVRFSGDPNLSDRVLPTQPRRVHDTAFVEAVDEALAAIRASRPAFAPGPSLRSPVLKAHAPFWPTFEHESHLPQMRRDERSRPSCSLRERAVVEQRHLAARVAGDAGRDPAHATRGKGLLYELGVGLGLGRPLRSPGAARPDAQETREQQAE